MINTKILCIDPSVCSLGWAVFEYSKIYGILTHIGSLVHDEGDWIERLDIIVDELYYIYQDHEPNMVIIEQPMIYHSGRGAAAANSESIMKLSSLVFAIRQAYLDYFAANVRLLPVRVWKKQVKKPVTAKRNLRHWDFVDDCDDIQDSVGLGDFWIRKHLHIKDLRNEIS